MTEEGGSPGGGAVSPPPAAPPATTAAPEAPKYVTSEQLTEQLAAFQNGFFANARKAGLLKDKPTESAPPPVAQAKPAAADPMAVLALRDAFDDHTSDMKLTKGQRSLLREHVQARCGAPGEVESVVSDYVSRAGWNAPASVVTPSAAQPAAPAATTANATAEAPKPAPAAAPSAPTSANLPTSNGVVDIFAPGVARQLGPEGLRTELEKLWKIGNDMQGKPQRPKPPSHR